MINRRVIVIIVSLLLVFLALYWIARPDEEQNTSSNSQPAQPTEQTDVSKSNAEKSNPDSNNDDQSDRDNNSSSESNNSLPEENPKTPPATVSLKPIISSSYGLIPEKPAPSDATVSTSCTTDARTECRLIFTNTDSGETVEFEAKNTDGQGVAIWEWVAGTDVESGTWETTAQAGDKSSDKEIVYVQ